MRPVAPARPGFCLGMGSPSLGKFLIQSIGEPLKKSFLHKVLVLSEGFSTLLGKYNLLATFNYLIPCLGNLTGEGDLCTLKFHFTSPK